ncbi:MAG: toll/interleukin-1 receptor domain-containing protein [Nitrospirales bacterium]|nr:toll/interleukin-1 receptor domain-containing protein [Nitrospirales bacterium]
MAGPKIFISYTTRDQIGLKFSEALFKLLTQEGYQPLRDRERLKIGEDWHKGLDQMIADCHGAVVLLSPSVKDSEWVKREADILSFRKRVCRDFLLLPILIGDTKSQDLKRRGFEDLLKFQSFQGNDPKRILAKVIPDLKKLKEIFGQLNPEITLEREIGELLSKAPPDSLIRLVNYFRIEVKNWMSDSHLSYLLGRHIAAKFVSEGVSAVQAGQSLGLLAATIDPSTLRKIFRAIEAGWVPIEAGRRLRKTTETKGGKTAIGSQETFVKEMYVRRAACQYPDWAQANALNVNGGEDQFDDLLEELKNDLMKTFGVENEVLDIMLRESNMPVILFIPGLVPEFILDQIQQALPKTTIIIGYGSIDQGQLMTRYKQMMFLPECLDSQVHLDVEKDRKGGLAFLERSIKAVN